ncbi:MAG: cyclic nucleotide-binding domain-containing protein [Chloroflexota bacterium]
MSGPEPIEDVFRTVPLFKRLNDRQRTRLAKSATRRSYKAGDTIVRQGDTSMTLYVILSGSARIERESEAGRRALLLDIDRGGFFGEMGLIDDVPRSATVTATEPTECALLGKWDFQKELRNDPDIAIALLPVLNGRIRELNARLASERPEEQTPSLSDPVD